MTVFDFISLLGGLALFLYGMRVMGNGLKQGSSSALKKAMEKVTNNPLIGFFLGLFVTAIIQSSTATIVLVSGLVAANIITLHQSLGIIIGANVGTTVTGQIIRLLDVSASGTSWLNIFKPTILGPNAAIIGIILIMMSKSRKFDTVGNICIGFGVLFTGLLNMTAAVSPLSESTMFSGLILQLADKPFLGFLVGVVVSFILQSSSATVGILQALSTTGALSFSSIYAILAGIYIGDCVTTAIVCSIGAKADAKRTGIIHILFNLSEIIIIILVVNILHSVGVLKDIWSNPITSGGIANTNTIFKLATAVLLLPVCGSFEKLSKKIIKDDKDSANAELSLLDEALFSSPQLALASVHSCITSVADYASSSVSLALNHLSDADPKAIKRIKEDEDRIDDLVDKISVYLVKMSSQTQDVDVINRVTYYMKCVSEFERIGDHGVNITEVAEELHELDASFNDVAWEEIKIVSDAINKIMKFTCTAFISQKTDDARHIEPLEEVIDDLVLRMRNNHLKRLRNGKCNVDAGFVFTDLLTNLERISDQCSNIGVHTVSLNNSSIAKAEHEYILSLHNGDDEMFNSAFKTYTDEYISRLDELESNYNSHGQQTLFS